MKISNNTFQLILTLTFYEECVSNGPQPSLQSVKGKKGKAIPVTGHEGP
jgi:hypothetical protein